jgi:hypothetical protein
MNGQVAKAQHLEHLDQEVLYRVMMEMQSMQVGPVAELEEEEGEGGGVLAGRRAMLWGGCSQGQGPVSGRAKLLVSCRCRAGLAAAGGAGRAKPHRAQHAPLGTNPL